MLLLHYKWISVTRMLVFAKSASREASKCSERLKTVCFKCVLSWGWQEVSRFALEWRKPNVPVSGKQFQEEHIWSVRTLSYEYQERRLQHSIQDRGSELLNTVWRALSWTNCNLWGISSWKGGLMNAFISWHWNVNYWRRCSFCLLERLMEYTRSWRGLFVPYCQKAQICSRKTTLLSSLLNFR